MPEIEVAGHCRGHLPQLRDSRVGNAAARTKLPNGELRIRKTKTHKGKHVTAYYVRCLSTDGNTTNHSATRHRPTVSDPNSLPPRRGEAFDRGTGLPVSTQRLSQDVPWFQFACDYTDEKWPAAAATTRRTIAEALKAITTALLTADKGRPTRSSCAHLSGGGRLTRPDATTRLACLRQGGR